ncbi:hypothetical protein D049_4899A, partial [Vibrio parahaemolyticus VPTS-2010]
MSFSSFTTLSSV